MRIQRISIKILMLILRIFITNLMLFLMFLIFLMFLMFLMRAVLLLNVIVVMLMRIMLIDMLIRVQLVYWGLISSYRFFYARGIIVEPLEKIIILELIFFILLSCKYWGFSNRRLINDNFICPTALLASRKAVIKS